MKGVQCYELFGEIALKNHAFSSFLLYACTSMTSESSSNLFITFFTFSSQLFNFSNMLLYEQSQMLHVDQVHFCKVKNGVRETYIGFILINITFVFSFFLFLY